MRAYNNIDTIQIDKLKDIKSQILLDSHLLLHRCFKWRNWFAKLGAFNSMLFAKSRRFRERNIDMPTLVVGVTQPTYPRLLLVFKGSV